MMSSDHSTPPRADEPDRERRVRLQQARIEADLAAERAEAERLASARAAARSTSANPGDDRRSATLTARIPAWLDAEVAPDMRELGIGKMKWGGSQGVATIALALWATLPHDDRIEMAHTAVMMTRLPEPIGRARLALLWPVRALTALSTLAEDARAKRLLELEGEARGRN